MMLLAVKSCNVIGAFPSIYCRHVAVKQSSIVSQIVSCPVVLFLLDFVNELLHGASDCSLQFSGLCSKLVTQLSEVSR